MTKSLKRFIIILCSVFLALALSFAIGCADKSSGGWDVSMASTLVSQVSESHPSHSSAISSSTTTLSSGNYYLSGNVTLNSYINVTGTVHICLNGKTLTGKSSAVIIVDGGTLYLHDCSSSGSGKITGGVGAKNIWSNASMGGGISIVNKGTLHMYGGNITGNKCDVCGGGIMMDGTSSMVMYGGTISGNSAGYIGGGGIYCAGQLLMTGGTISGNSTSASGTSYPEGGGVAVGNVSSYYGTFEMTGGTISGNSSHYGGGVGMWSGTSGSTTFKMSGGTISGNTATYEGGGIYIDGNLTITGGTISGNTCKTSSTSYGGGGISMYYGSASVSNAEISGNTASSCSGGGINVYSGCTMTLSGCTITGNSASKYGGGIYFSGTLKMSGKMIVHANSGSDVYLQTSQYITLSGKLTSGADVGVYFSSSSQSQVTASESSTSYYKNSYSYFFSNRNNNLLPSYSSYVYFLSSTSSAYFSSTFYMASGYSTTRYYTDLSSAVASADVSYNSAATVKPLKAATVSSYVTISSGTSITFDLNNYTVTGSSYLFSVSGSLTITDSSSSGNGKITGCSSSYGAIYVKSGGSLTISGGTLTGNYSSGYGGAVYLASSTSSSFSMTGGKITGNTAKSGGAGIYVPSKGVAYFSGSAYVYDNTVSGKQNNIYIASGANINFSSSSNASKVTLGVTAAGTGSSAVQITNTVSGISSYYEKNILPDSSACEYVSSNAVYLNDSHTCGTFFTYGDDGTALVEVICKYCGDVATETRNVLYKVENGVAKKYVEGYEDESTETLSAGYLVEDENGNCVYYTDLAEASAGASSGSTLYILEDISSGEIALEGGVTIDLGGHTVEADIVSSGTVKVTDTNSENVGEVLGSLSGGTFILEGGIYSGSGVTLAEIESYTNWDEGYVVYVSEDGYEVLDGDSAEGKSAACVKYTAPDGSERTVFFESLEEAMKYVSECEYAVEVALLEDVEGDIEISGVDITLDLNGYKVSGKIQVSGGDVEVDLSGGNAGSLEVSSNSGEVKINIGEGSLGDITVSGASDVEISVGTETEDGSSGNITVTDSKNVKIDISSGEAGDITVSDATEVTIKIGEEAKASSVDVSADGNIEIEVSGAIQGAATVLGKTSEISIGENASVGGIEITSGDADVNLNGASTGYVKVSTSGDVNISLNGGSIGGAVEVSSGNVTIEAGGDTESSSSVGSIEATGGSLTLNLDGGEIEGDVAVTSGSLNLNLGDEGQVSGDIKVLGGTAEIDMGNEASVGNITVSGGSLVLDLSGGTVEGNLTATGFGSLTVEDSSSEKSGTVEGMVSSDANSSIKLHAGTYNESVENEDTGESEESGVLTYVDWTGSYVAVYDSENKTYTVTASVAESEAAALGYGALVTYEDGNGNTVTIYYSSLASAVENAPDGSTIKLLCDTEENTDITFSSEGTCGITLDLNGHTLDGDITVDAGASVTIINKSGAGQDKGYSDGTVTGNITVAEEGSLTITAGTYYDGSCVNYFPTEGTYVAAIDIIFENTETGGKTPTYTYIVMTEETAKNIAADAYVEVKKNDGNKTYYIDLEDALFDISSTGGCVTLLKDSESEWENEITISGAGVEVTIDLNGKNVYVNLIVEAGSVENDTTYTAGATLLIEDTSTEDSSSGGSVLGNITVEGVSTDSGTSESGGMTYTNSFAGTLLISKTVSSVSNLSVVTSLSSVAGTVGYTFGVLYVGSSEYTTYGGNYAYGIIAGHQCVYDYTGATWSISHDGKISLIFVCVECKNPETDEDGKIVSYTKDIKNSSDEITCTLTYEDGVVTVSYTASITIEESNKGYYDNGCCENHTYSSEGLLSITAKALVVFTDGSENTVTLYFEDIETALLTMEELLTGETPGYVSAEIILLSDAECDFEISSGTVTINLNGFSIDGAVTVSEDAQVTIKDDASVSDGGSGTIKGDSGSNVTGEIFVEEGGSLTVEAGRYIDRSVEFFVAEGYIVSCEIVDGVSYYTVGKIDTQIPETYVAKAVVTVGEGEDALTYEIYYTSLEDALADATDGETIVILQSCVAEGTYTIEKSLTIDLGGNTVTGGIEVLGSEVKINLEGGKILGDITVEGAATLIMDGSAESDAEPSYGIGTVIGEITVEEGSTLVVEGGAYSRGQEDETYDNYDEVVEGLANGAGVIYVGEITYTDGDDEEKTVTGLTIMDEDTAKTTAEASRTYTDEGGNEITVYYESLEAAVKGLEDGDVLVVLKDVDLTKDEESCTITIEKDVVIDLNGKTLTANIEVSGASVDINLEGGEIKGAVTVEASEEGTSSDVTINLGGGKIDGGISLDETSSLTIIDEGGEILGEVTGKIETAGGSLIVEGGIYSENVLDFVADGKVMYVGKDDSGNKYYVVTTEDVMKEAMEGGGESCYTIGASVTYTDGNGKETTVYFEDPATAIDFAVGLEGALEGTSVTVELYEDLKYEGDGGITTKEGDDITINLNGNTITGDITVADGSSLTIDLGGGSVAGSITVGDTGNETAEKTASLVIEDSSEEKSGSVTGEIKAGENSEESANITIEGGTYYGGDVFDFLGEGKVEYVGKDGESGENYYVVGTGEEIEESDLEIGAKVTYTSAAGETVTIYFEDPADAVDYALSLEGVEEGSVVIVELFDDLDFSENEEGMKVETSYAVEIDLKGNSISGDITVESGSSLTIRDTSGDMSGKVSGNITETSGGAFVAEGGTYSEDVFEFLGDGKVEYVGKDSESQENYYVVGTEAEIENSDLEIGAKVVYKDVGGGIVTVYFEDPVDAIDFAVGLSDVEKGTTVLVELYADLDYTGVTDEKEKEIKGIETKTGSDITINLNGNSIIGDITVKAGSTLTIEDTDPKDYGEGSKVDGEVTIEGGDGEEKAGELKISGGMYTGDITKATLDDGSFVLILTTDEEERISVVADEETAKAYSEVSVEIDGKTVYYEGIDAAIKDILAVLESDDYDGAEIIMTVYGENVVIGEAGFSIPSGSVTIDLNGGELEGSISLGGEDGEGEVSLTFTDSSGDGSGKFEGKVAGGENADITLDGGTYSKDAFEGCEGGLEYGTYENENGEAETYVPVYGSEFIYVVTESEAEIMSVACVEDGDGSREYFTDVEDAIDFAAENGGVVTLYDDAVCRESVEINADVTIDLNGHTLDADIIIYADNDDGQGQGGSLYVTGSKEEGGWLTGEIVVVGSDTSEDGTNPYKETLVLDFDEMDGSLTISVEDKDGKNLENYVFSKTEDGFGIVRADEHTHSYVLAVWNYLGYGKFTLMFKCACGEYDEFLETYTAEATENEDGTVTFTLSVTVMDPSHAGTYEYEKTMSFAAKVSINGETVYFEDLDEAIGAAIESGATLILMCDAEANLNLTDGESLTIDLNGNELSGEIEIEEGASLEIEGVGVVTSEIESYGELIIRGGTYYEDVTDYLDAGYAVMVGTDKDGIATYTVLSESAAKESSEASVTNENGSTIYYESLEDALAALENGCTLTLQADIEEDLIICLTDEDESIEIGLDLNGYEIWGDVIIETGESESFSFEISDSSADGERGYGKILGEIEGADSVTLFGGNFEGDISGFDIAESCAVINNADGSKSVVPEGVAKDLSGAVIEAGENTYYYELLQDAVAAAEGMDEDSFVVMTADCLSDVTITSSVTIDLNGYEIEGDVHVEAEASLTFTDSSAGCEGAVSGDVLGSGDVILSGGTFRADAFKETTYEEGDEEEAEEATESVGVELGKDTIVVVGRGEKGEMVFTVMTEDEAEKFGYTKVETKGEDGGTQTLFFTDFDEAINYAATFGGTVTLYSDEIMLGGVTISAEVEIDLNGHTLCADITVDAVTYPGASLKVTCGSEEGGKITGSLVVIVEDSKGDENPYEETLKISSANDIGNLDVSIVDVAGTAAQNYFLTEDEAESSYVIGMGKHDHAYDIAGWAYDEKTCTFTFILKCACGDVSVTEIINAKFSYDKDTNTVTVSAETETKNTDGEPYTYEVSFTPEAELKIYDEDGEVEGTYYFESLEDAIAYVAALEEARASLEEDESGEREIVSEITLLSDVENVEIVGGAYITIDLNGKEILGTVSVDEDSSLKVSGSGTIDAALDIRGDVTLSGDNDGVKVYPDEALGIAEGGVLTVEGNVEIILDIGDNLDIGYYFEEEDGELIYESGLIIEGDLIITVTGDNEILAGDGTFISEEGSLKIVVESGAALTIDTCGTEVDACVTLEGRSSLEVVDSSSSGEGKLDGTVTVFEGADVSLYDGTYKDYPDGLTITFVDADGNEIEDGSMLMESAMAEDGERYIHSTTEKEHKAGGHSYDLENYCVELAGEMATFYELDAETSEIVMYFKCYCGEELTVRIHITEDDYFSEAAKNAEGERIVRVLYNNLSVTVTSSNGISASYLLHGETVLEMFTEAEDGVRLGDKEYDDYNGKGYRYYYIYEPAGCDHTGEDIYIYGSYSGVVIRETVGITHTGLCVYEERGGHTIYYCSDCECYFIDNTSVSASDAYDYSEVEKELEREQSFNETKESLMESLDMAITGCAEESGSIWGIYSGALDELDGREYEFTGGEDRDAYLEALTAEIEDIAANALFEIAEENQRGQTKNALESFFEELLSEDNQSFLDEYYSKEAQDELNEIYAAVMGDVESADFGFSVYDEDAGSSYADYTEYLEGKYSEYIENVIARVNAVNVIKVDADEDESDSDVIYSFISNDNGISGVIKLVIEKSDDKKLDKKIKNAELVSGDGKIEDDKLAEYIEDKSVVGVYDFSLWDTSSNARVYVFSGVYYVCLQLPEELKGRDDLVIVYLGDDGVLEVYSTSVSEDGESLYFSTTHFSEYIILGDSQRDLTAIIIVLAVVGGVALIALIILLVIFILRKRDENGGLVKETKTAALAPAALLLVTVVPSGAIGIIIALSVVDAALIAGAIVMAWLVSTRTQKNAVLEVPAENESLANSPLNNFTEYDPSNPDGDVEMGKSENDNQ